MVRENIRKGGAMLLSIALVTGVIHCNRICFH